MSTTLAAPSAAACVVTSTALAAPVAATLTAVPAIFLASKFLKALPAAVVGLITFFDICFIGVLYVFYVAGCVGCGEGTCGVCVVPFRIIGFPMIWVHS